MIKTIPLAQPTNQTKIINIVFTGPPSSGKTTTLQKFSELIKNVNIYPEISRDIIKHSLETNSDVLPWKNAGAFDALVLESRFHNYQLTQDLIQTKSGQTIKITDRSVFDTYAYSWKFDCLTQHTHQICQAVSYDIVFMFPFEESIYTEDSERKESKELAIELQDYLIKTYTEFQQPIIYVEFDNLENRVNFIIQKIQEILNIELDR